MRPEYSCTIKGPQIGVRSNDARCRQPAIYEVRGISVKPSIGPGFCLGMIFSENRSPLFGIMSSARLLLAGAGGVGLQRPDALGERPAALLNAATCGRAVGPPRPLRRDRPCGGPPGPHR